LAKFTLHLFAHLGFLIKKNMLCWNFCKQCNNYSLCLLSELLWHLYPKYFANETFDFSYQSCLLGRAILLSHPPLASVPCMQDIWDCRYGEYTLVYSKRTWKIEINNYCVLYYKVLHLCNKDRQLSCSVALMAFYREVDKCNVTIRSSLRSLSLTCLCVL
jgi:hypothetical protein